MMPESKATQVLGVLRATRNMLESIVIPCLLPAIMYTSSTKDDNLYATATFGVICATLHIFVVSQLSKRTKILYIAALNTTSLWLNITGAIVLLQINLCYVIHRKLTNSKRTFSTGESIILAQLATTTITALLMSKYAGGLSRTTEVVIESGLLVYFLSYLPGLLLDDKATLVRYGLIAATATMVYVVAMVRLDTNPVLWLLEYILSTHQHISLFCVWLAILGGCVGFARTWAVHVGQTNHLMRKVFHLAISLVFITGYNQSLDFTRFAAGGMIVVFGALETVRSWQLEPFGRTLEEICSTLRGKWDNKYMTLSHIYLLIGTLLPLFVLPENSSKTMLSAGVISVGVGDSFAAIVGSLYGKRKLGDKTLEGLLAGIVSMLLFKFIWIGFGEFTQEFAFMFAATMTAIVETSTKTCDNLTLPLVMMFCLKVL